MSVLAAGLDYVDLRFRDRPQLIATAVLHGTAGIALVDPGPATTLATLESALADKAIRLGDIQQILLTHIHLDHAGATGAIVEQHPHIEVFVHARGAPHLVDPTKLLASAGRLYGQDMDRLWGAVRPVAADRIRTLQGGETLQVAGREVKVEYTPGHASHHVSFLDVASRVAFVGDTAGIRRASGNYVLPPTPPPDIDIEIWRASAQRILGWDPDTLFLTHFGRTGVRDRRSTSSSSTSPSGADWLSDSWRTLRSTAPSVSSGSSTPPCSTCAAASGLPKQTTTTAPAGCTIPGRDWRDTSVASP